MAKGTIIMGWLRRRRYATSRQHSEEDCGAACVAAIAKHYGYDFPRSTVREAVGTGKDGTTLLGLQRGSEALGFRSRSVQADASIFERLGEMPLPAILHWRGVHWVVFYGRRRNRFVVMDPGVGLRYLTKDELKAGWADRVTLLLEPVPDALAQTAQIVAGSGSHATRWLQQIWFHRTILGQVLATNVVLGGVSLSMPFLIQVLTDDVLVRQDVRLLNMIAIAISVLVAFGALLSWLQANLIIHFAKRLELGLVLEFGRKLLHLPLNYFESHRSGEVVSRLQDVQMVYHLVAHIAVGLPGQMIIALVSLMLMVVYSPGLTGIALGTSVLMTIITLAFLPALRHQTRAALVLDAENQGLLVETFKGALTLKTMVATGYLWEELQDSLGRLARVTFRTAQLSTVNTGISGLVSGLGNIVLLWAGSHLVMAGRLSIGQLLAFYSMNRNFMGLMTMVVSLMDEYARVQAATQRLSEVTDTTSEGWTEQAEDNITLADAADIRCQNLSFFYGGQITFIDQLSVEIPGGRVTAIVGSSGCGKSTLVKLIACLYPLQSGNIRIGSYNLQDLSLDCLRSNVVLVPQEAHFWSRSIIDNFRLAAREASIETIVEVCQRVGADGFISQFPQAYHTVLGEFGANLSGGQRQRLAIARALLRNPPVLILDEAMSGLDHESETQVLESLLAYRQGKTTILISHRPSVLQYANWVIEMDGGQLIRQGDISKSDLFQPLLTTALPSPDPKESRHHRRPPEAWGSGLLPLPDTNPQHPQWSRLSKTG